MGTTQQLREALGFSQQQMASYLCVTRAQVAMAEADQRNLPSQAILRWGLLEQSLQNDKLLAPFAKAIAATEKRVQKNKKLLQKKLQNCKWQLQKLQYQLTDMQQRYRQCQNAFHAVAFLRSKPKHVVLAELDVLALNLLEQQTFMRLDKCDVDAQETLTLRIKLLQVEVEELEKLLAV